jgi:hypothetical protein
MIIKHSIFFKLLLVYIIHTESHSDHKKTKQKYLTELMQNEKMHA